MSRNEWFILAVFVGAVWGVSFISPDGAALLAGLVAVAAVANSDIVQRLGL